MKSLILLFSCLLLFSNRLFAATACSEIHNELKVMKAAQKQIIESLISNHEAFASTLEEYSALSKTSPSDRVRLVAAQMDHTAQAFRERGIQGRKISTRLNVASDELIERISRCLK